MASPLLPTSRSTQLLKCCCNGALLCAQRRQSHIGRQPIALPPTVTFVQDPSPPRPSTSSLVRRDRALVNVQGPRGSVQVELARFIDLAPPLASLTKLDGGQRPRELLVKIDNGAVPIQKAIWALTRQLLHNAIVGVTEGHQVDVALVGVGYRAALDDADPLQPKLTLRLGFSHPVIVDIPRGLECRISSPTSFTIHGADKQAIGQFAASIRKWRKPEPYNGKGVFVGGETVRRKEVRKR